MSYHLSLSLSRELWEELLHAALPVRISKSEFHLTRDLRRGIRRLGVRQRVSGLLTDHAPAPVTRLRERARQAWTTARPGVNRRLDDIVRIQGTWRVELDDLGTELTYGKQKVHADAFVKGIAEGSILLLGQNIEVPFLLERRIGASISLGNIRFDPGHDAVIGSLEDLGVYIGDHAALHLLSKFVEYGLEQQLPRVNPIPILRRDQVQEMVGPMGGALKLNMGVEAMDLVVDDGAFTLKVRFGFTRKQITEQDR